MPGDPCQVLGRVDVVGAAGVAALDERNEIRPGAQEGPGALVSLCQRDHVGPVPAGEQHGVAGLALVGGDRDAGPGAVRGDQPRDRSRPHQRLVRQRDHRGAHVARQAGRRGLRAERVQRGAQRRAHAAPPLRVVDDMRPGQLELRGAGDDEDRLRAAGPQQRHTAFGEGQPVQFDERLRPAEPGALARGEQHARHRIAHGP